MITSIIVYAVIGGLLFWPFDDGGVTEWKWREIDRLNAWWIVGR